MSPATVVSSNSVVKMIGLAAVPTAWILAPAVMNSAEADSPVVILAAEKPLMMVPGWMVSSAGASTWMKPFIK
jgi:hypothetical protein